MAPKVKGTGLDYILKSETKEEQGWNILWRVWWRRLDYILKSEIKGGAGLDYILKSDWGKGAAGYYEEWSEGGAGLDSIMKSEVKDRLDWVIYMSYEMKEDRAG